MKTMLALLILFSVIALPALGELTDADLDKIRLIINDSEKRIKAEIKEEIKPLKADIAALKTGVARLDGRMDGFEGRLNSIEKQISHATNVTYGLIALIVVAIGIPSWRGRRDRTLEKQVEILTQEIETLKQKGAQT